MKEAKSVVASLGLKISSLQPVSQDCFLPQRGPYPIRHYPQQIKRNNFIQMYSRAPLAEKEQQQNKLIQLLPRHHGFASPAVRAQEPSLLQYK
jgi:hypothetical protein